MKNEKNFLKSKENEETNKIMYFEFASNISFLELGREEYRASHFDIKMYEKEISFLESMIKSKKKLNIYDLSEYVKKNPRSFIIFQQILQLQRFTNVQLIHFIFDVVKLNSRNLDSIIEYLILNLKNDIEFRNIFLNLIDKKMNLDEFFEKIDTFDKKYLVAIFKTSICVYIDKVLNNFEILKERIIKKEFEDFSIRFSNYLLNYMNLNEVLESINLELFLKNKRIPIDSKKLNGLFLKNKIMDALEKNGYVNLDSYLKKKRISILKKDANIKEYIEDFKIKGSKFYCTEKFVEGVFKPHENKKLKKFDLIIFKDYRVKYLFEMNFYSTEGTKIGINQNEYISLNSMIKNKFRDLKFFWITDGNYWLTKQGKERYFNLIRYFGKIYNINLFTAALERGEFL